MDAFLHSSLQVDHHKVSAALAHGPHEGQVDDPSRCCNLVLELGPVRTAASSCETSAKGCERVTSYSIPRAGFTCSDALEGPDELCPGPRSLHDDEQDSQRDC